MKKSKVMPLVLSLMLFVTFASVMFTGCDNTRGDADTAVVVYHLNYDDGGERRVEIPIGAQALDWKAPRDGYKIKDWYTDSECKNEYDFTQTVNGRIDLYAAWTEYGGKVSVTFDYNYPGSLSPLTIKVDKGGKVDESYAPTSKKANRLAMELNGWYTDKECTREWDFASDTADDTLTLYAGYVSSNTIPRDDKGNIIYDNVQVNVWMDNGSCRDTEILLKLAEDFNKEYEGRICVNASTALDDQALCSVRMQSTPEKNRNEGTYYSITDIYKMADIEYNSDLWYSQVLKDSVYKGALTSVPMFASVPYVVYNKSLMTQYFGDELPKNYTELTTALKAAYEGEHETNSKFKSILTLTDWTFKEATSSIAFLQNGAEYYDYDESTALYGNDWNKNDSAGAATALENMYNLFAKNGDCHGGVGTSSFWDEGVINAVNDGDALMGLVNFMPSNSKVVGKSNIDVMPLSGLFTDSTNAAEAARIPVHTVGLAFYKASKVSHTELAAGAVFADYCSKHSDAFTKNGWYPIRKDCANVEKFDPTYKDILKKVGNPENFYTFAGYNNGKTIVNTLCAEKYVVPAIEASVMPKFDELAKALTTAIGFEINN